MTKSPGGWRPGFASLILQLIRSHACTCMPALLGVLVLMLCPCMYVAMLIGSHYRLQKVHLWLVLCITTKVSPNLILPIARVTPQEVANFSNNSLKTMLFLAKMFVHTVQDAWWHYTLVWYYYCVLHAVIITRMTCLHSMVVIMVRNESRILEIVFQTKVICSVCKREVCERSVCEAERTR